jgi:KaiC/GvpD/RAD55 family RecA-like ATPase
MVKLIVGRKGTGKTKIMVDSANQSCKERDGSIVFIIKDDRLKHDLDYNIRMIVMDEYDYVTNIDEYIGFIYGIISSNHDIQEIFIDSILKHADIAIRDLPEFLKRLQNISEKYAVDFIVSLSAELDELDASIRQYEIINK